MIIKYANQMLLSGDFTTTSKDVVTSSDTVDSAIGKIQSQGFPSGTGVYISDWDASTNTPPLSNSTPEAAGNWYNITVTGTVDFGNGPIVCPAFYRLYFDGTQYLVGDYLPYPYAAFYQWSEGYIMIGQGIDQGTIVTPISGVITLDKTGLTSFAFNNRLIDGTFDATIIGGVQYINADAVLAIDTFVLGRPYIIYNNDTVSHTYTFQYSDTTNTGIILIGGDALTNRTTITQVVNAGDYYTFTLQAYNSVIPTATMFIN